MPAGVLDWKCRILETRTYACKLHFNFWWNPVVGKQLGRLCLPVQLRAFPHAQCEGNSEDWAWTAGQPEENHWSVRLIWNEKGSVCQGAKRSRIKERESANYLITTSERSGFFFPSFFFKSVDTCAGKTVRRHPPSTLDLGRTLTQLCHADDSGWEDKRCFTVVVVAWMGSVQ